MMKIITKKCFVCKGTGKYGRLFNPKSNPQPCWVCHSSGTLTYKLLEGYE